MLLSRATGQAQLVCRFGLPKASALCHWPRGYAFHSLWLRRLEKPWEFCFWPAEVLFGIAVMSDGDMEYGFQNGNPGCEGDRFCAGC